MKKETVIIFTKFLLDFMYFAGIVVTLLLPVPAVSYTHLTLPTT